jgi:hypothetical protein
MKKVLLCFFLFLIGFVVYNLESRKFICLGDGKCVTVWKTYNNNCYVIIGKYYGLFKPSFNRSYVKTTNTSLGIDLIWEKESKTIIVQLDSGSVINNSDSAKVQIINYNLNKAYNDSVYTYFDNKLRVRRYKRNIVIISAPINEMGAL